MRKLTSHILLLTILAVGVVACRKKKVGVQRIANEKDANSNTGTTENKIGKFTLKISTDDANTARVWLDTVGQTKPVPIPEDQRMYWSWGYNKKIWNWANYIFKYSSSVSAYDRQYSQEEINKIKDNLISKNKINPNDAQIVNVQVYSKNPDGTINNLVEEKINLSGTRNHILGANFNKEFELASGKNINIIVKSRQDFMRGDIGLYGNVFNYSFDYLINDDFWGKQISSILASVDYVKDFLTDKREEDAIVTLNVELLKDGKVVASRKVKSEAEASAIFSFDNN